MKKVAYKGVRVDDKGDFYSLVMELYSFKVKYEIGVKSVPTIGALFAFDNLEMCMFWLEGFTSLKTKILECKYDNYKGKFKPTYLPQRGWHQSSNLRQFWNNTEYDGCTWSVPMGTILCQSVTPLEIVEWNVTK